jgi:hypothetical protein
MTVDVELTIGEASEALRSRVGDASCTVDAFFCKRGPEGAVGGRGRERRETGVISGAGCVLLLLLLLLPIGEGAEGVAGGVIVICEVGRARVCAV